MSDINLFTAARAKKSLGQHFLRDERVVQRIVDLLRVEEGDNVMEIGPGPGALTALLRPLPWRRLLLLEKDDHYAAEHAARPLPGLEVVAGDALAYPWESLEGPWKIAGNLPYNVASPLMWDIVSRVPDMARAVFMIQKEVGDRLLARPGSRDYGALSVWVQSFAVTRKGFVVDPAAFSPPPKVDSAVVVFEPLPPEKGPPTRKNSRDSSRYASSREESSCRAYCAAPCRTGSPWKRWKSSASTRPGGRKALPWSSSSSLRKHFFIKKNHGRAPRLS